MSTYTMPKFSTLKDRYERVGDLAHHLWMVHMCTPRSHPPRRDQVRTSMYRPSPDLCKRAGRHIGVFIASSLPASETHGIFMALVLPEEQVVRSSPWCCCLKIDRYTSITLIHIPRPHWLTAAHKDYIAPGMMSDHKCPPPT